MGKVSRSIYIDDELIKELEKEAVVVDRTFNNYVVKIIKERNNKESKDGEKES